MAKRKRKSKDATEEADAGELRVRQYLLTVPVLHDNPITQDDLQAMVSECILDRLKARLPQLESQPEPESLAPAQERITRPFEPGDIEQALRLQPAQECPSAREPEKELPPWQP